MAERTRIENMAVALEQRLLPTLTTWNRLEARPRTAEFDRALAAEVRDPLWMICRQWQLGEYRADDAGSPVAAKAQVATTRLSKYQPADRAPRAFSDESPIEAQVECRPLPFQLAGHEVSLDIRLLMGRQWLRMLSAAVGDFASEYKQRYPILPIDPNAEASAPVAAHLESRQQWSAVAGRMMDGYALYHHIGTPGHHAYEGISVPQHRHGDVDVVAARFVAWFEQLIMQPRSEADHAWRPPYLEYQFRCAAPETHGERVYAADEYFQGRLDWYNLDREPERTSLGAPPAVPVAPEPPVVTSFVPGQVSFDGMPNARWWAFEDGKVNLGDVTPNTTDLGALLFLEFGLVYANDWFVVPLQLAAGSIASVQGLAVTNVFGERTWIEPAGRRAQDGAQRWGMFEISFRGREEERGEPSLVLLPAAAKIQDGPLLEDVSLIRDEVANMVWGVETRVPLPSGGSKPGAEAARETRAFLEARLAHAQEAGTVGARAITYQAAIRYRVMNEVPEHWIPFIPVHVENSNREVQLQRAALPRVLADDPRPLVKIEPRSVLLREGLDHQPRATFHVHEEEVPRAGARLFRSYRRTRWYGGRVITWLGAGKQAGRGEGSSGLAFDSLVPVKTNVSEDGSTS